MPRDGALERLVRLAALTALVVPLAACGGDDGPRSATLTVHHSRFSASGLTVTAGQRLTLELRNDDPIDHEWIVGDDAVHARHRDGAEPAHDERPTEVTVPALATRVTSVVFDRPGDYRFVCHLPGHEAYGMTGVLTVLPA